MLKNWLITCELLTPLAGDPPKIDSLLGYELSLRLGYKYQRKLTKKTPLSEIENPPIPLSSYNVTNQLKIYRCSDPILGPVLSEWVGNQAKRFDSSMMSLKMNKKKRKNLLVASGPHKMRYVPVQLRLVKNVCWFVRGDKKEINKLLKSVWSLGKYRHYGYGRIKKWCYKEQEKDFSIIAEKENRKVLMKTVPFSMGLNGVDGWSKSFGGMFMPYWHPETFGEVAKPC